MIILKVRPVRGYSSDGVEHPQLYVAHLATHYLGLFSQISTDIWLKRLFLSDYELVNPFSVHGFWSDSQQAANLWVTPKATHSNHKQVYKRLF